MLHDAVLGAQHALAPRRIPRPPPRRVIWSKIRDALNPVVTDADVANAKQAVALAPGGLWLPVSHCFHHASLLGPRFHLIFIRSA